MVHGLGLWYLWLVVLVPSVHVLDGSVKCEVRGMGTEGTIQRDTSIARPHQTVRGKEDYDLPSPVSFSVCVIP